MSTHSETMDRIRADINAKLHQCCGELRELDATGVLPEKGVIRQLVARYSDQSISPITIITSLVNEASRDYVIKFWTGP